jgi:hypothetical protein
VTIVPPFERLHAWLVTGPPGHLWSAAVDVVLHSLRAAVGRSPYSSD